MMYRRIYIYILFRYFERKSIFNKTEYNFFLQTNCRYIFWKNNNNSIYTYYNHSYKRGQCG